MSSQNLNKLKYVCGDFTGYAVGALSNNESNIKIYKISWVDCLVNVMLPNPKTLSNKDDILNTYEIDALSNVKVRYKNKKYTVAIGNVKITGHHELISQGETRINYVSGFLTGTILDNQSETQICSTEEASNPLKITSNFLNFFLNMVLENILLLSVVLIYISILSSNILVSPYIVTTYTIPYVAGFLLKMTNDWMIKNQIASQAAKLLSDKTSKAKNALLLIQILSLTGIVWHMIINKDISVPWAYLISGAIPLSILFLSIGVLASNIAKASILWTIIYFLFIWILFRPETYNERHQGHDLSIPHSISPSHSNFGSSPSMSPNINSSKPAQSQVTRSEESKQLDTKKSEQSAEQIKKPSLFERMKTAISNTGRKIKEMVTKKFTISKHEVNSAPQPTTPQKEIDKKCQIKRYQIPQATLFDFNKYELNKKQGRSFIKKLSLDIQEQSKTNPNMHVMIIGHADKTGESEYNMILSEKRSESVKLLMIQFGVDASWIETKGVGSNQSIYKTNRENRRVDILVYCID